MLMYVTLVNIALFNPGRCIPSWTHVIYSLVKFIWWMYFEKKKEGGIYIFTLSTFTNKCTIYNYKSDYLQFASPRCRAQLSLPFTASYPLFDGNDRVPELIILIIFQQAIWRILFYTIFYNYIGS